MYIYGNLADFGSFWLILTHSYGVSTGISLGETPMSFSCLRGRDHLRELHQQPAGHLLRGCQVEGAQWQRLGSPSEHLGVDPIDLGTAKNQWIFASEAEGPELAKPKDVNFT